ncbi:unnamed protein product [Leuciscus chuanchicus]
MDKASDYGSEDSRFDSWLARSASFASLSAHSRMGGELNPLGEAKESSLRGRSHTKSQRACSRREEDPIWSSGQDSWFSPRRPGFDSRYGKLGLSLAHLSRQPARLSVPVALLASGGASATWWVEVLSLTGVPSIAQLVERRTVGGKLAILRSLVRLRLEGGQLGTFVEELDVLLSSFPEDGTPLLVFGDFNIHLEKPHATDLISLLASFDLKRLITTDPIPSHLLQAISPTLLPALTHIINSSLHTGTFPTAFKQARVTTLLKKPTLNTSSVENYRPISLLPFIAKTLERAVFNQVTSFLSQNNQLDVNQSGFKKGHSTETALLSVTEALRIAKTASKSSVLILLDLSAAFDTVNHQILMSSLSSLGITGTSLRWFEGYLTGRSFRVAWRGEASRAHHLTTGVPQGSVLGPLLFSIYTTSLGHIIQAHGFSYHCYADDTQLFLSFQPDDPTVAARISSCLVDISTWMKELHLQLNLAKTELLVFPANPSLQHDFTIQLESSSITPSRSVRNLGVTFDDQLTFTDHISKTARSCRFALHNIRKIRPFLTEHATQLLVQALVISRLDYCNALLAGLPSCATKPLQMIQNAAARLVFNEPKRAHVTPLFISLHWLPLAARIKFKAQSYGSTSLPEAYDRSKSDISWFHHRKPQNHFPEHSHSQFHAGGTLSPPSSGMQNP